MADDHARRVIVIVLFIFMSLSTKEAASDVWEMKKSSGITMLSARIRYIGRAEVCAPVTVFSPPSRPVNCQPLEWRNDATH